MFRQSCSWRKSGKSPNLKQLTLFFFSYFEMNFDIWRQFGRVIDMSDILLLILDVRYAYMCLSESYLQHLLLINIGAKLFKVIASLGLPVPPSLQQSTIIWSEIFFIYIKNCWKHVCDFNQSYF